MTAEKKTDNLTGFWTGVYDYPDTYKEPVPFNAVIEDTMGSLSGEIIEPNTFSRTKDHELFASFSGTRQGSSVHFIKTYEKVPQGGHSIAYEGTVDESFTKITGTWKGERAGLLWSGPFLMNRADGRKAQVEKKTESELEIVKTQ